MYPWYVVATVTRCFCKAFGIWRHGFELRIHQILSITMLHTECRLTGVETAATSHASHASLALEFNVIMLSEFTVVLIDRHTSSFKAVTAQI
jgi:hypothetical protein